MLTRSFANFLLLLLLPLSAITVLANPLIARSLDNSSTTSDNILLSGNETGPFDPFSKDKFQNALTVGIVNYWNNIPAREECSSPDSPWMEVRFFNLTATFDSQSATLTSFAWLGFVYPITRQEICEAYRKNREDPWRYRRQTMSTFRRQGPTFEFWRAPDPVETLSKAIADASVYYYSLSHQLNGTVVLLPDVPLSSDDSMADSNTGNVSSLAPALPLSNVTANPHPQAGYWQFYYTDSTSTLLVKTQQSNVCRVIMSNGELNVTEPLGISVASPGTVQTS